MVDESKTVSNQVSFVQEGKSDLNSQSRIEEVEQSRFETDSRKKERKCLQEQLKDNAIMKQQDFNSLVKERNSFNRLSKEDVDFYESIHTKSKLEEQKLQKYLSTNLKRFEKRKAELESRSSLSEEASLESLNIPKNVTVKKSKTKKSFKGIVKKKKPSP